MITNKVTYICLVLFVISALCVCTGQNREQRVPLQVCLGWLVNANSAGQITALEKNFYQEKGLEVEFLPGGLSNPSVQAVTSGSAHIGFANSPDLVISARSAGAPLKIVAVIHQKSYHGFFFRQDSGIKSPKDWIGKRVGVKYGSPTYLYYQAILDKMGIDKSELTEIPVRYGVKTFLKGDIDVYPGAFTNEAIVLSRLGLKLKGISPADYGIHTYGNVIFTSDQMAAQNSKILSDFISATLDGWRYCFKKKNEDEVLGFLKKHSDKMDIEKEREALRLTIKLVQLEKIGTINKEKIESIIDYLMKYKIIKRHIPVSEVILTHFIK